MASLSIHVFGATQMGSYVVRVVSKGSCARLQSPLQIISYRVPNKPYRGSFINSLPRLNESTGKKKAVFVAMSHYDSRMCFMLCCENSGWERVGCVVDDDAADSADSAGSFGLPSGSHLELEIMLSAGWDGGRLRLHRHAKILLATTVFNSS
jgi:hypothetical protein